MRSNKRTVVCKPCTAVTHRLMRMCMCVCLRTLHRPITSIESGKDVEPTRVHGAAVGRASRLRISSSSSNNNGETTWNQGGAAGGRAEASACTHTHTHTHTHKQTNKQTNKHSVETHSFTRRSMYSLCFGLSSSMPLLGAYRTLYSSTACGGSARGRRPCRRSDRRARASSSRWHRRQVKKKKKDMSLDV